MLLGEMCQSELGILAAIWHTVAIGRSIGRSIAIDDSAIGFPPDFKRTHDRTEELKSKERVVTERKWNGEKRILHIYEYWLWLRYLVLVPRKVEFTLVQSLTVVG